MSTPIPSEATPAEITRPKPSRLAYVGGVATLSAFLWIATFGTVGITHSGDSPLVIWLILLASASATSAIAVGLGVSYGEQKATANNQVVILEAVGQLAREVEQLSERVKSIDPMSIYAAVAGDLLNQDRRT